MRRREPGLRPALTLLLALLPGLAALGAACAGPGDGSGRAGAPVALPSAPVQIPVVLWFDDYNEVFEGTATQYGFLMPQTVDVQSRVGHARCVGQSQNRIVPPETDPPLRCDGVRGESFLTCSDGREIAAEWWTDEGCGSGYGKGVDRQGHVFHLTFGGSPKRAAAIVRDALDSQSGKPALPQEGDAADERRRGGVSTGTAFFVTWDGHLLTNDHVVREAHTIQVRLDDGDLVDARVVSRDQDHDLALLRVEAIRQPLPLRRAHGLAKGSEVFTVGYPLVAIQGQEPKATFGHVNALSGLQGDARYTQVDVPIQPGNSGGPLFNGRGEVVGVITSMLHPLATLQLSGALPQNVNYALKSDYAHRLLRHNLGAGWDRGLAAGERRELPELVPYVETSIGLVVAQ